MEYVSCVCVWLGRRGCRGMRGLVLDFTNPVGTRKVLDMWFGWVWGWRGGVV